MAYQVILIMWYKNGIKLKKRQKITDINLYYTRLKVMKKIKMMTNNYYYEIKICSYGMLNHNYKGKSH